MPDSPRRTELLVDGMTCRACEVRVGKALRAVPGVRRADASARTGRVRVELEAPVDGALLAAAVRRAGYRLGRRPWLTRDRQVWRDVGLALVAVAVVVAALSAGRVDARVGQVGSAALSGSLGLVLLLGVVAGLSTCMALVGGLVLAVAARHAEAHPDATTRARLVPHLAFNAGRVVGFTALGAVLGGLGSAVRLSAGAVAVMTLVVALAMTAVGLQLTAVSPRLSGLAVALPPGLGARLGLRAGGPYGHLRSALLGAGTFVMPCGVTQAVQLYALSTGSATTAAVVLGLFALGTAPGLLAVGGATAAARGRARARVLRFAGVAVLAFAVVNAAGAVTVLAPGLRTAGAPPVAVDVIWDGDVQVLSTVQAYDGYRPERVAVVAGAPVRWEIDSVEPGCAGALYAPELGLGTVILEPGVNVLELAPLEPGTHAYSCAMGMYTGVIEAVPAAQVEAAG